MTVNVNVKIEIEMKVEKLYCVTEISENELHA